LIRCRQSTTGTIGAALADEVTTARLPVSGVASSFRGVQSTDPALQKAPSRSPTASACAPYREEIEQALRLGRNAYPLHRGRVS
jgi:hypothetical protein